MPRLILCVLLAACSATPHAYRQPDVSPADSRELTRTADAQVHRDDPEKGPPAAAALAREHGGWVAAMNGENVTLRVPNEALDGVMDGLPSLGEVAGRHVRATDVTEAHADLETRIENLQKTRERYLALLEKAENVTDAAAVEREIERVTGQLELLQRQLESMTN